MRPGFTIAMIAIVIGLSYVRWWAGLLVMAWIGAMYAWYRLGGN